MADINGYVQSEIRAFVVPIDIFSVPDLSIHEQMTYIVLQSHASFRDRTAFPSYQTIAQEGRMSRRQAVRCVERLVDLGLLQKQTQMRVTRHHQITQTSNLYQISTPRIGVPSHQGGDSQSLGGVTPSHQGGDSQSPGGVTPSHQGGDSQSPKQDHLTDPSNKIQTTTSDNPVVVVDKSLDVSPELLATLTAILNRPMTSLLSQLSSWGKQYGHDYIIQRAQYVALHASRNPLGAFRRAMEEQWDIISGQSKQQRDERYTAFYRLFPNA